MVGDEAHALAAKDGELIRREHVDARQHWRRRPRPTAAAPELRRNRRRPGACRAAGRLQRAPRPRWWQPRPRKATNRPCRLGGRDSQGTRRTCAWSDRSTWTARSTRCARTSRLEERTPVHREARVDVPPEAAHLAQRRGRGPACVICATVSGREHAHARSIAPPSAASGRSATDRRPCRTGRHGPPAAHASRRRIVHDAAQHQLRRPSARPRQRRTRFSGRDPRSQGRRRQERRVTHAQRLKDVRLRKSVQALRR